MRYAKKKILCSSILAVLASPSVFAQGAGVVQLEEIVVTATRTETLLQDTPVAVTAMSGTQIDQYNIRNLQDLAAYVPSMSVGNRAGEGSAGGSVSIRGMGVDALDSSAAVASYIDDVYFASNRGNILGIMDIDRVEVLRGPQGTLFGRNAIAGAVQYVTVAPGEEFEGYLKASAGERSNNDYAGAINIPVSDTFAVRLAGIYQEYDGWVRDQSRGVDLGDGDSWAGRLRAKWQPNDRLRADIKYEHVDLSTKGVPTLIDGINTNALFYAVANNTASIFGQPPIVLDDSQISSQNDDPDDYKTNGVNGRDKWDFKYDTYSLNLLYDISDNLAIHSITAYAKYKDELWRDADATPLPILEVEWSKEDTEVFTQELRLIGSAMDDRLRYTTGVYYYDGEEKLTVQQTTIGYPYLPALAPPLPDKGPKNINESWSVFAQSSYDLADSWTMTLGYRYTDEDATAQEIQGVTEEQTFNFTDSSPYFGLDYRVSEDAMVYAKAAKGFRAGGRRANALLPTGGTNFDPETAWTYETGLRWEFMDGRARFNPTAYFTDWQDIQFLNVITSPSGQPAVTTQNAGDAEIWGIELEGQFAVTANLTLRAMYSYMNAEYTKVAPLTLNTFPNGVTFVSPAPGVPPIVPTGAVPEPSLTKDSDLQRAPENKFALGAMYTYALDGGAEIVANADYLWTDDQQTLGLDTAVTMPSYGVLNGRITYNPSGDKWSIALYGNNLTNEYYLTGGVDFAAGYTVGTRQYDVGQPRELGVAATFNF